MAIFLKLGEKASSFSDSSLRLNIINSQVVKVPARYKTLPKIRRAINGGHLVEATSKEFDKYVEEYEAMLEANLKSSNKPGKLPQVKHEVEEEEEEDREDITKDSDVSEIVNIYSLPELKAKAKELGVEYKNNSTKVQVANAIVDFLSMEDDEEDD